MPEPMGVVSLRSDALHIQGVTYELDRMVLQTRMGNLCLSPEGTHRALAAANACSYPRAVVVGKFKWKMLIEAINEHMMNVYDAGDGDDEDIQKIQRALDSLENGLF
jgi:hypothetical protein